MGEVRLRASLVFDDVTIPSGAKGVVSDLLIHYETTFAAVRSFVFENDWGLLSLNSLSTLAHSLSRLQQPQFPVQDC